MLNKNLMSSYNKNDITKCHGENCHKKEVCKRYTTSSAAQQYYFDSSPINNGKCEFFIELTFDKEKLLKVVKDE